MTLGRFGRGWPKATAGMRIGLLGGSFNPPHEGHVEASKLALKRLGLDQVWWLVTPGNPLKDNGRLPPMQRRIDASRALVKPPFFQVTGIESVIATRFTFDTLRALQARYRDVHFVWLMGADNLAQFHRWHHWRAIAQTIPIAVIDRPSASLRACLAPAALSLAGYRLPEEKARLLSTHKTPAWSFLHGLKSPLSSTLKRSNGGHL